MRTVLICHEGEPLNRIGLARWLASFSDLAAVVVIAELPQRKWRRITREIRRVGWARFIDVAVFRLYYSAFLSAKDHAWQEQALNRLCQVYPDLPATTKVFHVTSPNAPEVRDFLRQAAPDLMIARCKTLLKEEIFVAPRRGTLVMHPGICPEYRNAHGCFWALANRDLERVGMTLLRIDRGIDTGPVIGYFRCSFDERRESHIVIQHRTVFDNLNAIRDKLIEFVEGRSMPVDTQGRKSAAWGQPWMTRYLRWKMKARQESA